MKLVTTAQQLRSALRLFAKIIEPRNTYPVLGTVLFDGAKVRGTNLDQELVVTLVTAEAKGKAAIDYRTLARLVALIPSDDTVTILGGKDTASISFSSGRYDLPCCDAGAYPEFKWSGQGAVEAIPASGLRDALAFVAPTIGREETRYYLCGASFQRDRKGTSVLVTTDGHRMAVTPFATERAFVGMIVPRQAVDALLKMVEPARIERLPDETFLRFAWSGMSLTTKLIQGTYPDWQRVIPQFDGPSITFDRKELVTALFRVGAIGARRQGPAATLAYDALGATLSAVHADHGTGREYLSKASVANVGGEQTISFRSDYLITLLKGFAGHDRVRLDILDGNNPMRVHAGGDAFTILMPMRGANEKLALETLHEVTAMGRAAA